MGLLTRLVTLPVSGPFWVLQRVVDEAERQLYDEDAIRAQLAELEERHERGELDEAALEAAEDALLERLAEARRRTAGPR